MDAAIMESSHILDAIPPKASPRTKAFSRTGASAFPERFFFLERRRGPRLGARVRARRVAERQRRRRRRRRASRPRRRLSRFRVSACVSACVSAPRATLSRSRRYGRQCATTPKARVAPAARAKAATTPGRVAVGVGDVASVARATRRAVVRAPRGRSRVVLRAARAARLGERHLASPPQARGVVGELAGQVRPAVDRRDPTRAWRRARAPGEDRGSSSSSGLR